MCVSIRLFSSNIKPAFGNIINKNKIYLTSGGKIKIDLKRHFNKFAVKGKLYFVTVRYRLFNQDVLNTNLRIPYLNAGSPFIFINLGDNTIDVLLEKRKKKLYGAGTKNIEFIEVSFVSK